MGDTPEVGDAEIVSQLQTTSGLFWERLRSSVNLPIVDSTTGASHRVLDEENRRAAAELKDGLDDFERRLEKSRGVGAPGTSRVEWCGELSIYESMREDRSGPFEQSEMAAVAKTLRITDAGIDVMDDGLTAFTSLTFLDLSSNAISEIGVLPPNLCGLAAHANQLRSMAPAETHECLLSVGLGFNRITELPSDLGRLYPSLLALDLSYNAIGDLDATLQALSGLLNLTHLTLTGNPMTLLPFYRRRVIFSLTGLKQLDAINLTRYDAPKATDVAPTPIPYVLLQATVASLTSLPTVDAEGEEASVGVVQVRVFGAGDDAVMQTAELPWSCIDLMASTSDGEAKSTDGGDAAPVDPAGRLSLKLPATAELRDGVKFSGVQVRVISKRVTLMPAADGDSEGDGKAGEEDTASESTPVVRLVGTASIALSSFLEPAANASVVLHERVALDLEPEFEAADFRPEMVISLELNPDSLSDDFRLQSTTNVLYDDSPRGE
eukprot:CAMPEP_0182590920 /NCGR_PEP_ID=MMETSP1324-20130603/72654_1 /TAXON_ID=236786 /ORGANISM="Florenciella sp., Strain RCC1587" /LENGTH=493 /DNA_ID=CAMNT_0024808161 /DNA_START=35 /DNA_END=1516 /DNA_ORIENTATION=+